MPDQPDTMSVVEAASVGVAMPIVMIGLPRVVDLTSAGDLVVFAWVGCIMALTAIVGIARGIPTGSLLGGTTLGVLVGWMGIASTVGFDFVMGVLALFSLGAVLCGSFLAYEWARMSGEQREPKWVSWRLVFGSVLAVLIVVIGLAILG